MSELDRALMRAASQGDCDAFERLVARHQAGLFRYVRGLTRSDEAAEDALQEGLLDAFRGLGSWRGDSSPRRWLFTVVRNAAFRGGRRRAGEPAVHEELMDLGLAAGWGQIDETRPDRNREAERVLRALDRLAPTDRELVLLRDVEGFTNPEVARMLDLSIPAVKSRIHRARLRLAAEVRHAGA